MSVSVQVLPGTLQPDQGKFSIYVYTNTMHGKMSLFILKQGVLPQLSNFIKLISEASVSELEGHGLHQEEDAESGQ